MKFHYPKLALFCLALVVAYLLFSRTAISATVSQLGTLSYFGIFLGGIMFAYGFTAPFAVGFFITANPQNIWLAGIIGGIGAMLSDLFIFGFVKLSFKDEFDKLKNTGLAKELNFLTTAAFGEKIKSYLTYVLAGFLIASPLPDEAGITLLAGLTKIKPANLAVISFLLNTAGIIVLLSL